jgi:hypothetical protein
MASVLGNNEKELLISLLGRLQVHLAAQITEVEAAES